MVFKARFAGTCPVCGKYIEVGEEINWEKGKKATHKNCGTTTVATGAKPQARTDNAAPTKRCWECGCRFTYADCKRNDGDWQDSYCGC